MSLILVSKKDLNFFFSFFYYYYFYFFEVWLRQIREYFYGTFYQFFLYFSFLCFVMGIYIYLHGFMNFNYRATCFDEYTETALK